MTLKRGYAPIMKAIKIRSIAYVTMGVLNLVGFVYLVGQTRYHVATATPEYYGTPGYPQELSSWFSGRP
jgi:hypothetical protein